MAYIMKIGRTLPNRRVLNVGDIYLHRGSPYRLEVVSWDDNGVWMTNGRKKKDGSPMSPRLSKWRTFNYCWICEQDTHLYKIDEKGKITALRNGNEKDMTGLKFGKLTAIERRGLNSQKNRLWLCDCDCGNQKEIDCTCLRSGKTKSCGCMWRRRGEESGNWRGGKYVSKHGYVVLQPRVGVRQKQIMEHRQVMEQHLGRQLLPKETVHHRDGCRSNNKLENLELFSSRHSPGQRIEDKIAWAIELLQTYPEFLAKQNYQLTPCTSKPNTIFPALNSKPSPPK